MEIKDRIKKLAPYFKEMQIVTVDGEQVIYIVVSFPKGWVIDDDIESKFNISIMNGETPDEYYFCGSIDLGQDVLFEAIEYNIEKMKSAIERAQLLTTKIKELREMFENEDISLEKLRSLKFVMNEDNDKLVLPKKKSKEVNQTSETETIIEKTVDDNE